MTIAQRCVVVVMSQSHTHPLLSGPQQTQEYCLPEEVETRCVSSEQRVQLKEQILAFRQVLNVATHLADYTPMDIELESILASSDIESIVDNCQYIFTV